MIKFNRYVILYIEGGLGKNIAATSLCKDITNKYPDRKLIVVCSYPEVFLGNSFTYRVFNINSPSNFYRDYIEDQDIILLAQDPYKTLGFVTQTKHIIENWCDILEIKYNNQLPDISLNYSQQVLLNKWIRQKPILVLQTNGGPPPSPNSPSLPPYSWTRDLPIELSQSIVNKYSNYYHIIHVTPPQGYILENVERFDTLCTSSELYALLFSSKKRILIDSALQHIAAGLELKSNVFWIGTSPKVFGYKMHNNFIAFPSKIQNTAINSLFWEYSISSESFHECPYKNINEIFNIQEVLDRLGN